MDTRSAAIRFEKAVSWNHEVKGCSFHNGLGWGANAVQSQNIIFDDNVWFNFRQTGVGMNEVKNIVFTNNVVSVVRHRPTLDADQSVDKLGGVLICSLSYPKPCPNMRVNNNLVAGSIYVGFTGPGHDCGANNANFKDNVAHSVDKGKNGMGGIIYPDPSKPNQAKSCYQGSHFTAYKCKYQGLFNRFIAKKVIFKNMISIDNGMGLGMNMKQNEGIEYQPHFLELKDSKIYGEYGPSPDCPQNG